MDRHLSGYFPLRIQDSNAAQTNNVIAGSLVPVVPYTLAGPFPPNRQVLTRDLLYRPVKHNLPIIKQHPPITKHTHCGHVMADEKDGASLSCHVAHLAEALFLKLRVTYRQNLIDN